MTPIDKESAANVCTADIKYPQHEAQVRFSAAGAATVVVRGVEGPGDGEVELNSPLVVRER